MYREHHVTLHQKLHNQCPHPAVLLLAADDLVGPFSNKGRKFDLRWFMLNNLIINILNFSWPINVLAGNTLQQDHTFSLGSILYVCIEGDTCTFIYWYMNIYFMWPRAMSGDLKGHKDEGMVIGFLNYFSSNMLVPAVWLAINSQTFLYSHLKYSFSPSLVLPWLFEDNYS